MKLFELRYRKIPTIDRIMSFVDEGSYGGDPEIGMVLQRYGINIDDDPENIRRELMIMDEFKVMQLYRALVGGK